MTRLGLLIDSLGSAKSVQLVVTAVHVSIGLFLIYLLNLLDVPFAIPYCWSYIEVLANRFACQHQGVDVLLAEPATLRFDPSVAVWHLKVTQDPRVHQLAILNFSIYHPGGASRMGLAWRQHTVLHVLCLLSFGNFLQHFLCCSFHALDILLIVVWLLHVRLEVLDSLAWPHDPS